MSFPSDEEIKRVLKKLENVEPSLPLPENATKVEKLKYDLCARFIIYMRHSEVTQKDLAKKLGIDPARLSEIVKYKINLFTVDRLMGYLELLNPNLTITVA